MDVVGDVLSEIFHDIEAAISGWKAAEK